MNRLAKERSPYLRHAAVQQIDWYPWCEEAFIKAGQEDKPVFLSSGAIWCHWCHVMAKECFDDDEVVRLLNGHFVSIKLDRDERPDIDRRYQRAVSAMGSGGGWPLSVFLTPDKKPFFGGTYFPLEDSNGRPGFRKVLREVSAFFNEKKEAIAEYTERLINHLIPAPLSRSGLDVSYLAGAVEELLAEYDAENGGFGKFPKFPMPGAIELLISRDFFEPNQASGSAVKKTLLSMARGGFHDHLQGGFHRYSTDEAWIIPHFEKMADDNAWLLKNYIDAYMAYGEERFREVAEGIVTFLKDVLSDPEGGFHASQDADVTPDDEGGYFTWTEQDFKKVLNKDEQRILSMHFIHEQGSMHHNSLKKVLFIAMEADEIAQELGMDVKAVIRIISAGKEKLLTERTVRQTPFIDKTQYTSLNGMIISACLHAYGILKNPWLREFPLKSLEGIWHRRFVRNELFHSDETIAVLDDYIYLTDALISAYEVTGRMYWLEQADKLMELCISKLWDKSEGGFFDSEDAMLGIRLKGIEDIPHPSANSIAVMMLLKLHNMTGRDTYYEYARDALEGFASGAKDMGIHSAGYYIALDAFYHMLKLTVETAPDSAIAETARSHFIPYVSIVYGEDKGYITPCIRGVCHEPVDSPDKFREFMSGRPFLKAVGRK